MFAILEYSSTLNLALSGMEGSTQQFEIDLNKKVLKQLAITLQTRATLRSLITRTYICILGNRFSWISPGQVSKHGRCIVAIQRSPLIKAVRWPWTMFGMPLLSQHLCKKDMEIKLRHTRMKPWVIPAQRSSE